MQTNFALRMENGVFFDPQRDAETIRVLVKVAKQGYDAATATIAPSVEQCKDMAKKEQANHSPLALHLYEQACDRVSALNRGKYYDEFANYLVENEDFESAVSLFELASIYDPSNYLVYHNWGKSLCQLNQSEKAISKFQLSKLLISKQCTIETSAIVEQDLKEVDQISTLTMLDQLEQELVAQGFTDKKLNLLKLSIYYCNVDVVCQSYTQDLFDIDTLLNGTCHQQCSFVCCGELPDSALLMTDFAKVTMECYFEAKEYKMGLDLIEYLIILHEQKSKNSKYNEKSQKQSDLLLSKLYYYKARILSTIYPTTVTNHDIKLINNLYQSAISLIGNYNERDENPSLYHHYALFLVKFMKNVKKSIKYQKIALQFEEKKYGYSTCKRDFYLDYGCCLWKYLNTIQTKKSVMNENYINAIVDIILFNLSQMYANDASISMHFEKIGAFLSQYYRNKDELEQAYVAYAYALGISGASSYCFFYFRDIDARFFYHHQMSRKHSRNCNVLSFNTVKDVTQNNFQLCHKYGITTFGQVFGISMLLEHRFWHYLAILNHDNTLLPQFDCRAVIRIIRTSLLVFHKSVSIFPTMMERLYFSHMAMISIGVLSMFMIDIQSFRKGKKSVHIKKFVQYIQRYVTDMIQPYLDELVDTPSVFRNVGYRNKMTRSAVRCLYLSYWILGDAQKCNVLTNKFDYSVRFEIDRGEFGIKIENINWHQNIKCSVVLDFIDFVQTKCVNQLLDMVINLFRMSFIQQIFMIQSH